MSLFCFYVNAPHQKCRDAFLSIMKRINVFMFGQDPNKGQYIVILQSKLCDGKSREVTADMRTINIIYMKVNIYCLERQTGNI